MKNKGDNTISQIVVKNVKLLCVERNISLSQVEKSIGVSSGYFSRVIPLKSSIGIETVDIIAKFFGISIGDITKPLSVLVSDQEEACL